MVHFIPDSNATSINFVSEKTITYIRDLSRSCNIASSDDVSHSKLVIACIGMLGLTAVARYDGYEPQQQNPHDDKLGVLMPDGQDVLLTTYKYSDGYYNRAEKQFYGFAKRTSTTYGCDLAVKGGTRCLDVVRQDPELDPPLLAQAGYRPLQIARVGDRTRSMTRT